MRARLQRAAMIGARLTGTVGAMWINSSGRRGPARDSTEAAMLSDWRANPSILRQPAGAVGGDTITCRVMASR